jgi:Tfp pilus assembly protein PilN
MHFLLPLFAPSQVFSQQEEDNLFLIQNQQEADEELEELQARKRDTR